MRARSTRCSRLVLTATCIDPLRVEPPRPQVPGRLQPWTGLSVRSLRLTVRASGTDSRRSSPTRRLGIGRAPGRPVGHSESTGGSIPLGGCESVRTPISCHSRPSNPPGKRTTGELDECLPFIVRDRTSWPERVPVFTYQGSRNVGRQGITRCGLWRRAQGGRPIAKRYRCYRS